jgi:hypothetical protein
MKIKAVINICHGGFGISVKAAKRLHELGEAPTWEHYTQYQDFSDDWYTGRYYGISRLNQNLIKVVEELKDEANGDCARLEVVEIDLERMFEDALSDYDGYEELRLSHTSVLTTDRN